LINCKIHIVFYNQSFKRGVWTICFLKCSANRTDCQSLHKSIIKYSNYFTYENCSVFLPNFFIYSAVLNDKMGVLSEADLGSHQCMGRERQRGKSPNFGFTVVAFGFIIIVLLTAFARQMEKLPSPPHNIFLVCSCCYYRSGHCQLVKIGMQAGNLKRETV